MASTSSPLSQAKEEIFNLSCTKTYLEERLAGLAGGATGLQLQGELIDTRRLLAEKSREVDELNEQFCNLEGEMATATKARDEATEQCVRFQAEAKHERQMASTAVEGQARAQAQLREATEEAATAASARQAALNALADEQLRVALLLGSLTECDAELASLQHTLIERISSSLIGQRSNAAALAIGAQDRAEKESQLEVVRQENARLHGSQAALSAQVAELSADLSATRLQAEAARRSAVESEGRVGSLEVRLQAALEESSAAAARLAAARTTADAANAEAKRQGSSAAVVALEVRRLEASLREANEALTTHAAEEAARLEAARSAESRASSLAMEQQSAADAIAKAQAQALEGAQEAERRMTAEVDRLGREAEGLRAALGAAQIGAKSQAARLAQTHASEMQETRLEHEATLLSLRGKLEEAVAGRAAGERRLADAEADARRLQKSERQAIALDAKCKALQVRQGRWPAPPALTP